MLVPVGVFDRRAALATRYARLVAADERRAVHVAIDATVARQVGLEWMRFAVKAVDPAAVRAGEYAERIPAFERRGIHVATGPADDAIEATWTTLVPRMPLDVVHGEGVVEAFADAARAYVAAAGVNEVVVVLAPSRGGETTSAVLHQLVTVLRRVDRVAPIVLPSLRV